MRFFICILFLCVFHSNIFAKDIVIYNGPGTSGDSIRRLEFTLQKFVPNLAVLKLDPKTLKEGNWMDKAKLLVMPGGADVLYTKELNGIGNDKIREFVQKGGAYLGSCAGAYYASNEILFDAKGPLEVKGKRELGFFPGVAIGPVLAPYDYFSLKGSRVATIRLVSENAFTFSAFFNGGPYFKDAWKYDNVRVWGWFQDLSASPAIISIDYANGKVLLSAVHFEYDTDQLDAGDPYIAEILPSLKESIKQREAFIRLAFSYLGLGNPSNES